MATKDEKQADKAAIERVQQLISDYRTQLEAITLLKSDDCPEPVMVEAETSTGYYCQLMVDPRHIAPILLKYDYPTYRVLEDDAPHDMWRELGEELGVEIVTSFDL